jgi:hypothetical protein
MEKRRLNIGEAMNLAVEKHKKGKLKEAEVIYRRILEKDLDNADARHLLGVIAHQTGRYEDAIKDINEAISIKEDASYYGNLAMVYDSLKDMEKSAENFQKALKLNPNYRNAHLAHYNLGIFFNNKGEFEKALQHYDKAIELDKDFFDARWNRSLVLLLLGRFEQGWKDYECRFKKKSPVDSRKFVKPKWQGDKLDGKKILVVSEQGYGDNIHFIRYVPFVKNKGGYVIFECRKKLKTLFENIPEIDELVEKKDKGIPDIDYDFYVHLMSLPRIFNTTLENIPSEVPYIKPDMEIVKKFNNNYFNIGIVWSGNPQQAKNSNRSAPFENFKSLKKIPNVKLFSLQKGQDSEQLDNLGIIDLSDEINDFLDTAAIIENLDLVVSVDTSVAHLAGAMGKPIWLLLPFIPNWRWLLNRKDSPWYPSMKLFRQKKQGDWDAVFYEVGRELKNLLIKKTKEK